MGAGKQSINFSATSPVPQRTQYCTQLVGGTSRICISHVRQCLSVIHSLSKPQETVRNPQKSTNVAGRHWSCLGTGRYSTRVQGAQGARAVGHSQISLFAICIQIYVYVYIYIYIYRERERESRSSISEMVMHCQPKINNR